MTLNFPQEDFSPNQQPDPSIRIPIIEVDFLFEEYAIHSRKTVGELFGANQAKADYVVVGKSLASGELIAAPPHLGSSRVYQKIYRPKLTEYKNHLTVEAILKGSNNEA